MAVRECTETPLSVVWGDDDFAVQRRARAVFDLWAREHPDAETETIDGAAANADEVQRCLARLREALQTLPFFGRSKSIWLKGCNFAGEDRVSDGAMVIQSLTEMGRELGAFDWKGVRLLVSAGKLDRRRAFFKTLDKLATAGSATLEHFPGFSAEDRDWRDKAGNLAASEFRALGKRASGESIDRFVDMVGPQPRALIMEAQKLAAYVGERVELELADVEAIVTRGHHARAFALGDAIGDRHLGRALRHLDEELWSLQSDRQKSEIGLLYGLIGKVRAMLLTREMLEEGLIRPTEDYRAFLGQLKRLDPEQFPADKRYNPLEINGYVLFRAARQSENYTGAELADAMEELLRCNRKLVGSGLDGGLVLQMAITRIVTGARPGQRSSRSARTP